jgi:hypothetical protein
LLFGLLIFTIKSKKNILNLLICSHLSLTTLRQNGARGVVNGTPNSLTTWILTRSSPTAHVFALRFPNSLTFKEKGKGIRRPTNILSRTFWLKGFESASCLFPGRNSGAELIPSRRVVAVNGAADALLAWG